MQIFKQNVTGWFKALALLVIIAGFASCKKDKDVVSAPTSVEGKWAGNKGLGNETPDNDLLLTIKPGGTIEETNTAGAVKGSGTWTLTGNNFVAHYQFKAPLNTHYLLNGSYDQATGKISGTWSFDDGDADEGNWYVNRK